MERTLKWHSPQSTVGSFTSSLLAHAALCGGIWLALNYTNIFARHDDSRVQDDTVYEMFDDVPEMDKVVHHAQAEAPQQEEQTPDTKDHEMQDEQSDVTGRQTAKEAAVPTSNDTQNTTDVPYYRIKPKYPAAALRAGVEGWVMLKVDIKEDGSVENIRVVDGDKRNTFEGSARQAVEKWKYKPFLDASGKAVRRADHPVRVDFHLTDAV